MHIKHKKIAIILVVLAIFILMFFCIDKLILQYAENTTILTKEKKYSQEKYYFENNQSNLNQITASDNTNKIYESLLSQQNPIILQNSKIENDKKWKLEIPKINLYANISEGTDNNVLQNYIGHFRQTSKWNGNIGLAAHNRGYKNNYFKELKQLEYGDKINYFYNYKEKHFKVEKKKIILNTDWSSLSRKDDNKLTLITCIENKPQYRLCVEAVEV